MGLKSLINRFSGNDVVKGTNALCYVFGEDKRYSRRNMESTGVYYQDKTNRLGYDSFPTAIGILERKANGKSRTLGPISIAYEPTSHMFSFPMLDWSSEEHKDDVILDTAFAEGCSRAVQREDRKEWMDRLMTIFLLAVAGGVILLLLIAIQSGVLGDFFTGLKGFFR